MVGSLTPLNVMKARTGSCAILSLLFVSLGGSALAQDKYWVAGGGGAVQIDASGFVYQTVPPSSGRDIGVAPDGKVWIVNSTITVLNPDGTPFTTVTPSASITPYAIAFDAMGHAWLTGSGGGVEEFDAAGTSLQVLTLPSGQPRTICVDAQNNKWIAHRIGPPGALSRIDGVTGAITTHPLPASSLILPITVVADSRGLFNASHIWTVGDNRGAGEVVEFDAAGNWLNTYVVSSGARLQWMTADCDVTGVTRNLWVGDWSLSNLHQVDVATGAITTYPMGTGVGGVSFDGFGDLWITMRGNGVVRRIDEATGGIEVESTVGGSNKIGTRWEYATVVDHLGDLDGDGAPNLFEVQGGTSPFDPCSNPGAGLSIGGSMGIGSTCTIDVVAGVGDITIVAFATGTLAAPIAVPGIGCTLQFDPATHLGNVLALGPASLSLTIPSSSSYIGFRVVTQGLNAMVPAFTNVAPMLFW